ncbi:MAG: hypothetical protein JWO08_4432 [Verrucomicrobiaceae bacterium]|nr:hypothetical protein [Verrucomicrobiaceae bacterium]
MLTKTAFFLLLFSSIFHIAKANVKVPEGGHEINLAKPSAVLPKEPGIATSSSLESPNAPGKSVWRFEIQNQPVNAWSVQLGATVQSDIKQGDRCLLLFHARAVNGNKAFGAANVERREPPDFSKLGRTEFKVGPKWEEVVMPFIASGNAVLGKTGVAIHLGGEVQSIELSGIRLLDYGPDFAFEKLPQPSVSYEGREPDAAWRKAALERIEKIRKGDFTLEVVDKDGKPQPNIGVHVSLKRHAFGFGTAVTAKWLNDESEDGKKYRDIVSSMFSKVVFENDLKPFAWAAEKDPKSTGGYRKEWIDKGLAWCAEQHIPVRGHYLMWGPWEPWSKELKDKPEILRQQIWDHMVEKLPVVGDRVVEWDCVNHPAGWEANACIDTVLGRGVYANFIKATRQHTKLPLWVNEDQMFRSGRQQEEYAAIIDGLVKDGAAPDGIGNMAHFHSSFLPSPEDMLRISDQFAKLVPHLQITEYDITANGDEKLAADFTRDILITAFSHPAYTGFVMWGFWEGSHWKPETALWRKDWSPKPAAEVWKHWVTETWRTDETLKTDAEGKASVRGFFGRYDVTVNGEVQPVVLGQSGDTLKIVLEK